MPVLAVIFDSLVGDPRTRLHPVVVIGNFIAALERKLLDANHTRQRQKWHGVLLVITVLTVTYLITWGMMAGLTFIHPDAVWLGGAFLLSFTISPRSLASAGQEIRSYLLQNNLEQARFKVGWIVGRDTQALDVSEVTRATVETIAENIVDGIIAPLFYFLLGGIPLAFLYRAVNTMDSMVGYKNDKYIAFGMPAARTDDLFNFIPARITALLIILAALLLRYDAKNAYDMIIRDASKHPSPNSGYAEAGVAGALGIRLGGINFYGGIESCRAYMGEARHPLAPEHIKQTIFIMFLVTGLFSLLITLLLYSLAQDSHLNLVR